MDGDGLRVGAMRGQDCEREDDEKEDFSHGGSQTADQPVSQPAC